VVVLNTDLRDLFPSNFRPFSKTLNFHANDETKKIEVRCGDEKISDMEPLECIKFANSLIDISLELTSDPSA